MKNLRLVVALICALALSACDNARTVLGATPGDRLLAAHRTYVKAVDSELKYIAQCDATPSDFCREAVKKIVTADVKAFGALSDAQAAYDAGDSSDLSLLVSGAEIGVTEFGKSLAGN